MPDDHSEVVPLLPIPNRTVKRLCADDSADSRVKVGHRQANIYAKGPHVGPFVISERLSRRDVILQPSPVCVGAWPDHPNGDVHPLRRV